MKKILTLIATQIISTIIAFTEYNNNQEIIALSLELGGIALILLILKYSLSKLVIRSILLTQAVIIYILMPYSQYMYFTGVYHILIRLFLKDKQHHHIIFCEWIILIAILLIFGTQMIAQDISRSVIVGVSLVVQKMFSYLNVVKKIKTEQMSPPKIVINHKIQYTSCGADIGSNPRSSTVQTNDSFVCSVHFNKYLYVSACDKQVYNILKIENDEGIQQLLDDMKIIKIDSQTKQQLMWKQQEQTLRDLLQIVQNNSQQLYILVIEYEHPYIEEFEIRILNTNGIEIQFHQVQERDQHLKIKYTDSILKQLFSTVSHEFGTSLNYLLCLAQIGLETYQNELGNNFFSPIKSIGVIMHNFVLDMVDYNDILGKRFELQLEKIDINDVLNEINELFSHTLKQKGLSLQIDIKHQDKILTDRRRLKQILINLVQNAQKFTLQGGINISVKPIDNNNYIEFEIRDTGIGLTKSEVRTLTELLEKDVKHEKKISKNTAGFGLGCYLSNKIALYLADLKYSEGGGVKYFDQEQGTRVQFKIKNSAYVIENTLQNGSYSDHSSGILKLGKNISFDLRQSILLEQSIIRKPITKNFSIVFGSRMKSSVNDDLFKDFLSNRYVTKEIAMNDSAKCQQDSIKEESLMALQKRNSQQQGIRFNLQKNYPTLQTPNFGEDKNIFFQKTTTKDIFNGIQGLSLQNTVGDQEKNSAKKRTSILGQDEKIVYEKQFTYNKTNQLEMIFEETIENEYKSQQSCDEEQLKRLQIQKILKRKSPSSVILHGQQQLIEELRGSDYLSEPYDLQCDCKKILIVDDEMINILALSFLLKSFDCQADCAYNGVEAFEKVKKAHCPYQLIFMDINMPLMDGYTATKEILCLFKSHPPKIIACTAFTDSETKQKCYDTGMLYFLNKPVNKSDLSNILNALI